MSQEMNMHVLREVNISERREGKAPEEAPGAKKNKQVSLWRTKLFSHIFDDLEELEVKVLWQTTGPHCGTCKSVCI